ncbi:2-oxo acid dehydrogenase subunit E2 [Agromyces mediolanus]|uniref:dihydrolipoamide acetyltransferase family protein n=1 Tax=Agromyces mediolanus TaxID=41986 RepID=UPI002040C093|nr:dihydrolipoamide acetyltransferase family protein [Agromyces mediolanus]MCM3657795.1 2-oxo acid dehydrogenase subunit E2 [Agromyces mediolanus]
MAAIIRMPEVLAGATEEAIQQWLVHEGDPVDVGTPLAEIETEKAVVEFTAESTGTVARRLVADGDSVPVGSPIIALLESGDDPAELAELLAAAGVPLQAPASRADAPEPDSLPAARATPSTTAPRADGHRRFASPIVRRLAAERGLSLDGVVGSGPDGRIVRRDLEFTVHDPAGSAATVAAAAVARAVPTKPAVEAPTTGARRSSDPGGGAVTDTPASAMRRTIARRLAESKSTIPHFYMTRHLEVDELLALRERINALGGPRVSVNDFIVKAVALAHRAVPDAAAIWHDEGLRRYGDIDVAVAVAVEGGLVTPVLRGVDRLSIGALAASSAELADRARAGALTAADLTGGTIAVSNLGMYGVDEFAAIINPPQSAILAVGRASARPIARDGALAVATMMSVTLSGDHRVMDGAAAAKWLAALADLVEHPLGIVV